MFLVDSFRDKPSNFPIFVSRLIAAGDRGEISSRDESAKKKRRGRWSKEKEKLRKGEKEGERVAIRLDVRETGKNEKASNGRTFGATVSRDRYCRSSCTINDLAIAASFLRSRDNCVDCAPIVIHASLAAILWYSTGDN